MALRTRPPPRGVGEALDHSLWYFCRQGGPWTAFYSTCSAFPPQHHSISGPTPMRLSCNIDAVLL